MEAAGYCETLILV